MMRVVYLHGVPNPQCVWTFFLNEWSGCGNRMSYLHFAALAEAEMGRTDNSNSNNNNNMIVT